MEVSASDERRSDFCLTMQEGARDGTLGTKPFKVLNAGLSGASLIHLLVFASLLGSDNAGPLLLPLMGVWGTSFAVSSAGLLKSSD